MIQVQNKKLCCGCSSCASVCPKHCIEMQSDAEGFLYPVVNAASCVNCGLCESVCPFLKVLNARAPRLVYAAKNLNEEERAYSSSGGLFSMIAKKVINDGGVVFGASFDDVWNVNHSYIEKITDIPKLQGSKYVQSRIGDSYKEVKEFLNQGKTVLFSGTACQIAGLKSFLHRDTENLITVDVLCHGVPSPKIWKEYVSLIQSKAKIDTIYFRDKYVGWIDYCFTVKYVNGYVKRESHNDNLYMKGYLRSLYLRPSCHNCLVKGGRCGSDLTLGDFWGVEEILPELFDNKGTSVVLVNSLRGEELLKSIKPAMQEAQYDNVLKRNGCIEKSTPENKWRQEFWSLFLRENDLRYSVEFVVRKMDKTDIRCFLHRIKRFIQNKLLS